MYDANIKEYLQKTNIHIYMHWVALNSSMVLWTVKKPHIGQITDKIRWMEHN